MLLEPDVQLPVISDRYFKNISNIPLARTGTCPHDVKHLTIIIVALIMAISFTVLAEMYRIKNKGTRPLC